MMNTGYNHGSATIYQFPVGGRSGLTGHYEPAKPAGTARVSEAAVGGSWYHDEAIRESQQPTKP